MVLWIHPIVQTVLRIMSLLSVLVQIRKMKMKQNKIGSESCLVHVIVQCCRIVIKMSIDWNILSVFCSYVCVFMCLHAHVPTHACSSATFLFLHFTMSYSL